MNYVYAGYGVTFGVLAMYAARVLWRGRALRRALSPSRDERP
jgi:heme exporter protein CcmD